MYNPVSYTHLSNSGCGCYVYKNEENRHYLKTNLSDNVRRDYFMIYILLLYQLYSLIHFSEKIEYELSADAKDYLKAPEAYNLKLKEIQAEINTFLLKSVHTSVSQMQTQNDFYQFAKKNLRLREEIQLSLIHILNMDGIMSQLCLSYIVFCRHKMAFYVGKYRLVC